MNKFTKGSLAAGAGTILLLGGAGTFMSWNAEAGVDGGSVTAGHLRLAASEKPATWIVDGEQVPDISSFQIVPGDIVEYTTHLELEAEGENLTAVLDLTGGAITPADSGSTADTALKAVLEEDAKLELTGAGNGITKTGENTYTVNAGGGTLQEEVAVTVTLTFPDIENSATHPIQDAMDGSVELSDMSVSLRQLNN